MQRWEGYIARVLFFSIFSACLTICESLCYTYICICIFVLHICICIYTNLFVSGRQGQLSGGGSSHGLSPSLASAAPRSAAAPPSSPLPWLGLPWLAGHTLEKFTSTVIVPALLLLSEQLPENVFPCEAANVKLAPPGVAKELWFV